MVILCILSGICFGGTIDPNNKDTDYIEYGQKFYYIGKIIGLNHSDELYYGSGVAYSDSIILTAAHVLNQSKNQTFVIANNTFKITQFILHDRYNEKNYGYYDIAMAKLDGDIGFDWYPSLYENRDEVGKICAMSGYGMTGSFISGAISSDNHKRAGSNIIDGIDRGLLVCTPSITNKKTSLEFLIAAGDSGGGLFIDNKLAGINSCIMSIGKKAKADYDTESGHTRISDHVSWIKKTYKLLKEK